MATEKVNAEVVVEAKVKGADKAAADLNKVATETEKAVDQTKKLSSAADEAAAKTGKLASETGKATAKAAENVRVTESQTRVRENVINKITTQLRKHDQEFRKLSDLERAEALYERAKKDGFATDEKVVRLAAVLAQKRIALTGALNDNTKAVQDNAQAQLNALKASISAESSANAAFNARFGIRDDFNTEERAADIAAYGAALDGLRAKINPVFAAERQYTEALAEANKASRVGALNQNEYADAISRTTIAYSNQIASLRKAGMDVGPVRTTTALGDINRIHGLDAKSSAADRAADIEAYGAALDSLRAKINPVYAAERQYSEALAEANKASRVGAINQNEYADAISRTTIAYSEQVAKMRQSGMDVGPVRTSTALADINRVQGLDAPSSTADRAADIEAYGSALDSLRAKINPVFAAERQYTEALAEANKALRVGAINQNEYADAIARTTAAYSEQVARMRKAGMDVGPVRTSTALADINRIHGLDAPSSTADRAADIAAYGAALDNLRAKINPVFAAERQYAEALAEANEASRTGAVDQNEYAEAISRVATAYSEQVARMRKAGMDVGPVRTSTALADINRIQGLDVPRSSADRGADMEAALRAGDSLRAKYDPLFAIGKKYREQIEEIKHANAIGELSHEKMAAAILKVRDATRLEVAELKGAKPAVEGAVASKKELDELASGMSLAGAKYRDLTKLMSQSSTSAEKNAKSVGLARHEITNLSQQMQDVVVSLGSGQTAMTVLLQQGSQVYDVLSRRQGGIASGVQALGEYLGGLASKATPAAAALGAVATAVGLAATGVYRWSAAQEALTVSLNGLGRASGVTIDQANATATVAARESGISVNAAQGYASQFLGAGVSGSNLRGGIGLVRDFARKLGLQEDEAAKTLAAAMADPARGAKELADKFGLLTRAQRRQVEETANMGSTAGAVAQLIGVLQNRLNDLKDPTTTLAALWERLGAGLSNAATAIAREFFVGAPVSSEFDRQKALANRDQAALDKATDRLSGLLNIAQDADLAAKAITATTYAEREAVVIEKSRLESLRDSANALKINAEAEAERTRMLADATAKVNEFIRTTARTIESFGKTSYERGLLQIRQERQDLLRQVPRGSAAEPTPAPTPSRRYRGTHAGAYEASQRSGYTPEATSTFSGGLFLIDGQPAARPRPAPAPAPAAGLDRTVSRQSGALEAAYISDAQRSVLRAANDDLAAQNRLLDAQAASFGKSAGEAARLNKEQELLNQYTREHIPITAEMRQRIAETAEGWGLYAQRLEDVNKKNAELIEGLDKIRGASTNAMSTFFGGLTRGESVGAAGRKVLDQLMDTGLNNTIQGAVDKLFGKAGTNGADSILGGLFGSLFGKDQKTQQMTVTAANVIVNGKGLLDGAEGLMGDGGFLSGIGKSAGGFLSGIGNFFSSLFPFADGGVMTDAGPIPLRRYASGGVANSPQLALFGEGKGPEAFVPLPDGRSIPVSMKGGGEPKISIHNYAGVQVEARKNAAGEIEVLIDRKIAANNARLPGMLSDYDRRRA